MTTVVLIEGYSGTPIEKAFKDLIETLKLLDVSVVLFENFPKNKFWARFRTRRRIEDFANNLAKLIRSINDNNIIIVAHSMGCLVSRYVVEENGFAPSAVILVAGPHKGCNVGFLPFAFVPCVRQMIPGSDFLQDLGLPISDLYWYIVGNRDCVVPGDSSHPVESDKVIFLDDNHDILKHHDGILEVKKIVSQYC